MVAGAKYDEIVAMRSTGGAQQQGKLATAALARLGRMEAVAACHPGLTPSQVRFVDQ